MEIALNAVHLWWLRTDRHRPAEILQRCERLLSAEERCRRDRLVFADDRRRYLLSHAMLRQTLSLYAPVAAQDWVFAAGPHGKPAIAAGQPQLSFSLTHTRGLSACAIAVRDVGVDAEGITRPAEYLDLARRFFAPQEADWIERLPEDWRAEAFFAVWTLKEAYIKARGIGLALPLAGFSFSFPDGAVKVTFAPDFDDPAAWQFERYQPTAEHQVAVAVPQPRSLPLVFVAREVEL
jgi:4'-phosphopantetheinyl transferase